MRALPVELLLLVAIVAAAVPSPAAASDAATATLAVSVSVASRTSLRVSADVLRFDVADPSEAAVAIVDVSAGARTREGGEVVLTIEPLPAMGAAGHVKDDRAALTFAGDGDGLTRGALSASAPAIAGRWIGSGKRTGRVSFALRGRARGTYTAAVRFVLSTP